MKKWRIPARETFTERALVRRILIRKMLAEETTGGRISLGKIYPSEEDHGQDSRNGDGPDGGNRGRF